MEVYDLDALVRDSKQDDLYNFFDKTYIDLQGVEFDEYIVQQDEEMRIDLICHRIYTSTDQIGFLLNFNGIENPLNIIQGDIIRFVAIGEIDSFKSTVANTETILEGVANADKSSRKDPSRKEFIEQGYTLPPNFNQTPQLPVQLVSNSLLIRS
jgi:hypothetical protein